MTTTDEKTPADRPAAAQEPANDQLADQPRDLAAYVRGLPTMTHLSALEARIEELAGKLARFAEKISELLLSHEEIVSAVDRHADRLTAINAFIEELSAPAATRRDAQVRTLPATKPGEAHELQIDPKKVGTTLARLPSGQEVEINVRSAGGPTIRDGRPMAAAATGKVRRS